MAADADEKDTGGPGKSGSAEGSRAGKPQRPPVTIDLTAERIATKPDAMASAKPEQPKADSEPPRPSVASDKAPPPRTPPSGGGFTFDDSQRRTFIAGAAGGIVALVLVIVLQGVGLLPAPGRAQANRALEEATAASQATSALERQVTAVQSMAEGLPAARADLKTATDRLAAVESSVGSLATATSVTAVANDVAALKEQVASAPAGVTPDEIAALAERISRLEVAVASGAGGPTADSTAAIESLTSQIGTTGTDVRALSERLAAAEAKLNELGNAPATGNDAAVRAIAITALRRAASGSEPFVTEVDMAASLGIAGADIASLRPFAERGVPDTQAITAEFPAVADAILTATANGDPNAGFFDRLVGGIGGLVSIRPAGPIAGNDPQAIVSRMVAAVSAGDLAKALEERAALPEAGQAASAAWAQGAADRVALDQLVDRIARAVDGMTG